MGAIPVLNDNQMNALRRIVGANQKVNLTVTPRGKSRHLPTYPEDGESVLLSAHQFTVVDASVPAEGETPAMLAVSVVDGHNPNSTTAGRLNGTSYAAVSITLAENIATFYIYAADGQICALRHTLESDLFPVLLLAEVTVANGLLTIAQRSFTDNPIVPVKESVYGALTLGYSMTYADHVLSVNYTVAVSMYRNNVPLTLAPTALIPAADPQTLSVYITTLTPPPNTPPEVGFTFGAVPSGAEWFLSLFRFTLTQTAATNALAIHYRNVDRFVLSFTEVYLNASET